MHVGLARRGHWSAVVHLEALEHVVAILLLRQTHRAGLAILLDFAPKKPRELATVAELKVLA